MDLFGWKVASPWVAHLILFGGPLLLGLVLRAVAVRGTKDLQHSPARILGNYLVLWSLLIGAYLALGRLDLPASTVQHSRKAVVLLFVATGTFFLAGALVAALHRWSSRTNAIRSVESPARFAIRLSVAILGILVALDVLGIPITPLVTTLGIGGIAVALALQETLSNFFSGVLLAFDQPAMPGQFIRLETGEEGYVEEIGWRSTRLRTPLHTIVIVPNSKLSRTTITNFDEPDRRTIHQFRIIVEGTADARKAEETVRAAVTSSVGQIEGLLADPAPTVRFMPGPTLQGLQFTVALQLRSVEDVSVEAEVKHRIVERLRAAGIALASSPLPT